jgi:hypothetical protein
MSKLHKLQQYQAIDHKGFKTESSLYNLYMKKPEYLTLSTVMLSDNERDASLVKFYNMFDTMTINSENEMVKWRVSGRGSQNCALEDIINQAGLRLSIDANFPAVFGANREHFYMIFDKPLFSQTQIIKNEDDSSHFQIHAEIENGGKTMYEVSLVNDNYDMNVSVSKVAINSRFNVVGAMVPDHLSDRGMKPTFTTEYEMAIRGGKFRMQYEISGAMIEQGRNYPLALPFRIPTNQGKVTEVTGYINAMDQACLMQAEVIKAKACLYGKKNWLTDGSVLDLSPGQFQVPSIMGLFEQIAPGNRHYYNTFDLDWLTDLILSKQIAKRSRNNRRVKLVTGEFGAKAFHEAVDAKVGASSPIFTMANQFIQSGSASNIGASNPLSFGYQYTQYRAVNGLEFEVEIADWMDDNEFFPQMHPSGLGSAESYRYLIMPENKSSGIYKLKPNNSQLPISKVIPGLRDPFTAGGKGFSPLNMAASSVDGYEVHHMDYMGLVMTDPEAIVDLRLKV